MDNTDLVFVARNQHAESCGPPPGLDTSDIDTYCGYFENAHGEQWVFTYNAKTDEICVRGGDVGWDSRLTMKSSGLHGPNGAVVLNEPERQWLAACLAAIEYRRLRK